MLWSAEYFFGGLMKAQSIFKKQIFWLIPVALFSFLFCTAENPATNVASVAKYVYNSTTNKGDLVVYTIQGDQAGIQWNVTDNTGIINYTFDLTATCGTEDATYGHRTCTVDTSSCTQGALICPATLPPQGSIFYILEVPGTAVMIHVPSTTTGTQDELHVGMISGGCPADVSGDYSFVRMARVSALNPGSDLFGVYRLDAGFSNVAHADFGFTSALANYTDIASNYSTGSSPNALGGTGCTNGVFTRTLPGGDTIRANLTSSGLFILDMPSGMGGMISFRTDKAASLSDLAGKTWTGVIFPDGGGSTFAKISSGILTGGTVIMNNMVLANGQPAPITTLTVKAVNDGSLAANMYTAAANYTTVNNSLATTYAAPKNVPGAFDMDSGNPGIVSIATKTSSGRVMLFGAVFNFRDTTGAGCTAGTVGCDLRIAGNFLLFSK